MGLYDLNNYVCTNWPQDCTVLDGHVLSRYLVVMAAVLGAIGMFVGGIIADNKKWTWPEVSVIAIILGGTTGVMFYGALINSLISWILFLPVFILGILVFGKFGCFLISGFWRIGVRINNKLPKRKPDPIPKAKEYRR